MRLDVPRPFYGIIWGTWALGFFTKWQAYKGSPTIHPAKLAYWKPEASFVKYYGFIWKYRFRGSRTGWTNTEVMSALIDLVELGKVSAHTVIKFEATKQLSAEHRGFANDYLAGTLVVVPPAPVKGIQHVLNAGSVPIVRHNKTKETLMQAAIEHDLRKPRYATLFTLAETNFGRDVALRDWNKNRYRWEVMFKDQLPSQEDPRWSCREHLPGTAEAAREIAEAISIATRKSDEARAKSVFLREGEVDATGEALVPSASNTTSHPESEGLRSFQKHDGFGTSSLDTMKELAKALK